LEGVVALAVTDLMFEARIAGELRRLGLKPRATPSLASLRETLDGASLVIVDLQAQGFDGIEAVREAAVAGARVIAFGQHTSADALRRAREAGATAMPRSAFFEQLPALVASALQPRAPAS
jgi:DNA-binding NarL/FixJ family response regulator